MPLQQAVTVVRKTHFYRFLGLGNRFLLTFGTRFGYTDIHFYTTVYQNQLSSRNLDSLWEMSSLLSSLRTLKDIFNIWREVGTSYWSPSGYSCVTLWGLAPIV